MEDWSTPPVCPPWPAVITARVDAGCPANRWCWARATVERAGGYSSACADVGRLHAGAINLVQARRTIRSRCERARMSRGPYLPDESRKSAAQVRQRRGSSNVNILVSQVWPSVSFPPLSIPEPLSLVRVQRRAFARPMAASLLRVQRRRPFRAPNGVSFARPMVSLSSTQRRRLFRAPNGVAFARPTAASLRAPNGVSFLRPTASLSRVQRRRCFRAPNGVSFARPTALLSRAQWHRALALNNIARMRQATVARSRLNGRRVLAREWRVPVRAQRRCPRASVGVTRLPTALTCPLRSSPLLRTTIRRFATLALQQAQTSGCRRLEHAQAAGAAQGRGH
jgi:hypothetical protein